MSPLRRLCVWITALAVLLAGPAASLAECLRCPPDCPMHAPKVERDHDASGDGGDGHDHHAHHGGGVQRADADHAGHGGHGDHAEHVAATQPEAAHDQHAHHGGGRPDGEASGSGTSVASTDDTHDDAKHATGDHAAHHGGDDQKDCHRADAPAAPRAPDEGPCISGVCGHMDVSIARVLPEGVIARPGPLAPELASIFTPLAPVARPSLLPAAPPTEPPRSLLA